MPEQNNRFGQTSSRFGGGGNRPEGTIGYKTGDDSGTLRIGDISTIREQDKVFGWSDYLRGQQEACVSNGCKWDGENQRCNCADSDVVVNACDNANCPEGFTCVENPNNATGYDCVSSAQYADTLEGYLDTVDLGGFCQGATSIISKEGKSGCEQAGGTWVDYESFFGPDYYNKIAQTFGFGGEGAEDYSEFFRAFPSGKFEELLKKLPGYEGDQQALINAAFNQSTKESEKQQDLINQAFKDDLISIDDRDELLKNAFELQALNYQQAVGSEEYKKRILQAYDEGALSLEERNVLLNAIEEQKGSLEEEKIRALNQELEKKKQSIGNLQRGFQQNITQLRSSLLGAIPGISEQLGTQFAGSGYQKSREQEIYDQSRNAFSNIVANTYIPDLENIKANYDLNEAQILEETEEAVRNANLKFRGDALAADQAEQNLAERANSIRQRKAQDDANLLSDTERSRLKRDETLYNLRLEMDKRASEVNSLLYDWLGDTLQQAGITAQGIETEDVEKTTKVDPGCAQGCADYDPNIYNSVADCIADCDEVPIDDKLYSCVEGECVEDSENGTYTTSDCDGDCTEGEGDGQIDEYDGGWVISNGACVKMPPGTMAPYPDQGACLIQLQQGGDAVDCSSWCDGKARIDELKQTAVNSQDEADYGKYRVAYTNWVDSAPEGCTEASCGESARYGANFITSGPQTLTVGDNPGGRELVQVTPLGSPNIKGPSSFLDQLYDRGLNYSIDQNSMLKDIYK